MLQSGDVDAAMKLFHKALKINPELAEAHFQLGRCLVKKRKFGKAQESLANALAVDPDHSGADDLRQAVARVKRVEKAARLAQKGESDRAVQQLLASQALSDDPRPTLQALSLLLDMGTDSYSSGANRSGVLRTFVEVGLWDLAEEWIGIWESQMPEAETQILAHRGSLYLRRGDEAKAREVVERLLSMAESQPEKVFFPMDEDLLEHFGIDFEKPRLIEKGLADVPLELLTIGEVSLLFLGFVDVDGRFRDAKPIGDPGLHQFEKRALEAISGWRFQPARLAGREIRYLQRIGFEWSLRQVP